MTHKRKPFFNIKMLFKSIPLLYLGQRSADLVRAEISKIILLASLYTLCIVFKENLL